MKFIPLLVGAIIAFALPACSTAKKDCCATTSSCCAKGSTTKSK